ncbi:SRPBCC family protein [Nocardioides aurantiacus]|uniref:Carbon monoxide dehydrogenase subunit G n=1 Tax=Nocardioides aurantiacus TaxID=86796 RepID=A0A3N2CXV6_9ACTN|nr:SRPBCC family protein [Nocardioides aurantiacus]ROR92258.1 carbon monoxide dehydrogenase subunit G [Nocardioides aurantiacus]
MDLKHEFTVPATLQETWDAFNDIASVGECFPGAQVTSVEGDTFKGTVKVKLGPIALVYSGTGTFLEKDESARTMKIEAKGKDKRGNGTAGADVLARMSDVGGGSTRVEVTTDLNITGKPAQFGRGVIQDVSDKLLGQFTACLEQKVGAPAGPVSEPEPPAGAADPAPATPADAGRATEEGAGNVRRLASTDGGGSAPSSTGRQAAPAAASGGSGSNDDALDLGATVLPVLAKLYWRQALGGLVVLWVLSKLLGRRSS